MDFHRDCLVIDGHTDVPTRLWESPADLSQRLNDRHVDLPRLREGGVDALVFALFVPASLDAERGWEHALKLYEASEKALIPGRLVQVASVDDLQRAAWRGEVAVLFGLENGRPLEVPGALDHCAKIGIRYVTLTHWASHEWCDASTDAPIHGGLSMEGEALVWRMSRLGILPDVSHVSDRAVLHTLDVSPGPVIASHSSARALCDHPRNLPDDLVREIARKGGLVMANSYPAFVGPAATQADAERMKELKPQLEATEEEYLRDPQKMWKERSRLLDEHPLPKVPLSKFVDHVVRLIDLGGEEHVGLGTDFDGIPEALEGFEDVSKFPALTAALLARGVDKAGVKLILGDNFLRVLREAERVAA
ncbi:MAG TPA: dipeptidase [Thermoanaerobaculia bacterium]|jgi:membrane dipeptidase|nr:dipeptidase [Thermoanaerobaculia bacterium]